MLDVRGLTHRKYFKDVSFSLHEGEILGMVGLEGQGQRHILRALYGDFCADSGEVRMHGDPIPLCRPTDALSRGIVFVPEERKEEGLCLQLDVRQNMALATLNERARLGVVHLSGEHEEVCRFMAAVELSPADPSRVVGSLMIRWSTASRCSGGVALKSSIRSRARSRSRVCSRSPAACMARSIMLPMAIISACSLCSCSSNLLRTISQTSP